MSYALVINDAGDILQVDLVLVEGKERGGLFKVSSPDQTSNYEATLLDSGTAEAMAARMDEWRGLTTEDLKKKARERRRNRGTTPISTIDPAPPAKKIDRRRKTLRAANATTPDSSAPVPQDLLVLMVKKVLKVEKSVEEIKNSATERKKWEESVTDDLTSINAFIELSANRTEADTIGMRAVVRSTENQEEAIMNFETQLTDIAERMPQKLDVQYIYLPESAVRELDRSGESCPEFGYRIAELIFSEEEMLMYVEDRNRKRWDWLVDVVYRSRAFTERIKSIRKCRSVIKAHLDQKAMRARADIGMTKALAPSKKRKIEREARKADLAARVDEMKEEYEERRVIREKQSIDTAAKVMIRQKGMIDDEGEEIVYRRPVRPPVRGKPVPRGKGRSAPTPPSRPTRPLAKRRLFPTEDTCPSMKTPHRRRVGFVVVSPLSLRISR